MLKLKTQKGITLIALIITIIVMLILVGVSVSVSLNGGLFDTAKEAADKTQAASEEERLLSIALGAIGEDGKVDFDKLKDAIAADETLKGTYNPDTKTYTGESGNNYVIGEYGTISEVAWKQNGAIIKHTDGRELKVGDYVTGYTAGDTSLYAAEKNWQILGADNGKVLITIANKPDNPDTSATDEDGYLTLGGKDGYRDAFTIIQTEANRYLNTTFADSVRSMNLDDINKITGYDPDVAKFKHDVPGEVGRYGNTVKYRMGDNYVQYTGLDGDWIDASEDVTTEPENELITNFIKLDGSELTTTEFSETSSFYRYTITDYITDTNNQAYKMLLGIHSHGYWLANKYVYTRFGRVVYGIFACANGKVDGVSLYDTENRNRIHS